MTPIDFSTIRGLLVDLEGVLYVGDRLISGVCDTIHRLKADGIGLRFLTNTTTKSTRSLYQKLHEMELPIEREEIINAPMAAVQYLRQRGKPKCFLVLRDEVKSDFDEFTLTDSQPDYVIIGDVGDTWTYDLMNQIFHLLINGAELIALHKSKYSQAEHGLKLDIGAFIAGLEYASGKEAEVIGKPSKTFFNMAIESLGVGKEQAAMIGDDVSSDIGGAQQAGIRGILVQTGKYREELVKQSGIQPDWVIPSFHKLLS